CQAQTICVTPRDRMAQCCTYKASKGSSMQEGMEEPVTSVSVGVGEAVVCRCDAVTCTYNEARKCTAGTIDVTFADDMAQCYTYTTSSS
ncbi:MAG TPA: DUF1540 domain-containing protein, partial [Candidatus Caenarcaniphilales bacterium]